MRASGLSVTATGGAPCTTASLSRSRWCRAIPGPNGRPAPRRTNTASWPNWAEMPKEHWSEVGHLRDIPRRGSRRVTRPGATTAIAVFRTADDRVFALVDRCPHRGGPLSEGIVQGCAVACPLHGWVVDLESGEAEAPDEGFAPVIAAQLEGARIWLSAQSLVANDVNPGAA